MKKLINSILTAVMLVSLTTMTGCGEKEINPADYVNITYTGVNGKGKANVTFDVLRFSDDLVANAPEKKQDALTQELMTMKLDDLVTYETNKETELSNGDTITVTLDWDDTPIKKDYKLKFAGENTVSVTVEDLPEVIELDAFDPEIFNVDLDHKGVHISVDGISPNLSVTITNDISREDVRSSLRYEAEFVNGYANGDTVKINVTSYGLDKDLYALKEEVGTLELNGYDEYINRADQLTEENQAAMKEGAAKAYEALMTGRKTIWDDWTYYYRTENVSNFTWDKIYLVTLKNGVSKDMYGLYRNLIFMTYSYDINGARFGSLDEPRNYEDVCNLVYLEDAYVNGEGEIQLKGKEFKHIYSYSSDVYMSEEEMYEAMRQKLFEEDDKYNITEIDISSWNE